MPNHCVECDKPTMDILCDKCKEKEMGKMKGKLIENMTRHPELYNGHADEEFWIQCRKEELLEKENKPTTKIKKKGKTNVRKKRKSN